MVLTQQLQFLAPNRPILNFYCITVSPSQQCSHYHTNDLLNSTDLEEEWEMPASSYWQRTGLEQSSALSGVTEDGDAVGVGRATRDSEATLGC